MLNRSDVTLIVADDEAGLRQGLAQLFENEGYVALQAQDGDEVISLLEQAENIPDAVFLDLKMPKRDGLSTLRFLKQDARFKDVPVVIITAFGGSEHTIEAMKAGAYDYITKPFDTEEVLQTARRAIEVSRLTRELESLRKRTSPEQAANVAGILPCARFSNWWARLPTLTLPC